MWSERWTARSSDTRRKAGRANRRRRSWQRCAAGWGLAFGTSSGSGAMGKVGSPYNKTRVALLTDRTNQPGAFLYGWHQGRLLYAIDVARRMRRSTSQGQNLT